MIFLCYPKCTTCQKAQKWLEDKGVAYTLRNIKEDKPSYEELKAELTALISTMDDIVLKAKASIALKK